MDLESLRPHFRGDLLAPDCTGYEQARRIWNGMINRRPAAIARCTGPADVVAAVRFAAEANLYPAIRAGGHNVAGLAMVDGGLVIDVSRMKGISVDPKARTATAQTGLTWGEFDRETQLYGLATTGGLISTTGIAGLTLGGGVGWLLGRFGMTCDNTLSYELVAANGELIRASAEENPDLFWALKGGGGNFGVVTSIAYRVHPLTHVISGMLLYPPQSAVDVLRFYRDFVQDMPDELVLYAAALTTPEGMQVLALVPAYSGDDLDEGERVLAPLRKFGPPMADLVMRMPYVAMQQMLDAAAPFGLRSYWKSNYLHALPDDAIEAFVTSALQCPSPRSFALIEHAHGAANRVAADATAFGTRERPFDLVVLSLWDSPVDDVRNVAWTREFYDVMKPWSAGLVYVNGLSEDDGSRIREAYSDSYDRLCEVKTKYDPDNRFRQNHNIKPRAQTAAVS